MRNIYIEWDNIHYAQVIIENPEIKENLISKKEIDEMLEILPYKTTAYKITKKNLDLLKKNKPKGWTIQTEIYDEEGNDLDNKRFVELAKKIINYIEGKTEDLSFLNEINN